MGLPYTIKNNSTLNERFGIQTGILPDADVIPTMRYFCIGNGGHKMSIGAGGISKTEPVQHRGTDAACFSPIPFVLREPNDDLSVSQRAQYALRRQETHQGTTYYAYYLKRLDFTSVASGMKLININEGVETVAPFVPDSSNLNPTPPDLSSSGVNLVSGDYVSASANLSIVLNEFDVEELKNVANVIYEDEAYAIISEIGLCSGVDKTVTAPASGGTTINFNEAIVVQIVSHINTFQPMVYSNNGSEILLDCGATEPLFVLE